MNAEPESPASLSAQTSASPWLEPPAFASLRLHVAERLRQEADGIAQRWESQSRSVALRESFEGALVEHERSAVALVRSVAATLAFEGAPSENAVALGLAFGKEAFERGASLHHTLKALELLWAMTLHAAERALSGETDARFGVDDGIRLCRRLQRASSLLTLAAAKGYTLAVGEGMRNRFRDLRHDLRNPLGTIRSVLAMMDDETLPPDARADPRFRAMARRNLRFLDEMIVGRLSDAAALPSALLFQSVPLRTLACAVRRDLRAEAEARGATVLVSNDSDRVLTDAAGLELMLHELLLAALQEVEAGDVLRISFGETRRERAVLRLSCASMRAPIADPRTLERLSALAARVAATVEATGEALSLSVPAQPVETRTAAPLVAGDAPSERARAMRDAPSAGGESRDDVRSAHEREHRQSGSL